MSEDKIPTRPSFLQISGLMRIIGWIGLLAAIYLIFFSDPEDRYLGYLLVLLALIALYRDFSRRKDEASDNQQEDQNSPDKF